MVGNADLALVLDPEAGNSQAHCKAKLLTSAVDQGQRLWAPFLSNSQNSVCRRPAITLLVTAPQPEGQLSGPQTTSLNTPLLGTTLLSCYGSVQNQATDRQARDWRANPSTSLGALLNYQRADTGWKERKKREASGKFEELDHPAPPAPVLAGQCRDGLALLSTLLPKLGLQFNLPTLLMWLLNPELSGLTPLWNYGLVLWTLCCLPLQWLWALAALNGCEAVTITHLEQLAECTADKPFKNIGMGSGRGVSLSCPCPTQGILL